MDTVRELIKAPIHGIKFHNLYVASDSPIQVLFHQGKLNIFEFDEYVSFIVDVLELVPPEIVIYRLLGEKDTQRLIAPTWTVHKQQFLQAIHHEFLRRGSYQGIKAENSELCHSSAVLEHVVY